MYGVEEATEKFAVDAANETNQIAEKMIAISFKTTKKLSADMLAKVIQTFLDGADKQGKQSLRSLTKKGVALSDIEITSDNIKNFEKTARKYGIDFALKKDTEKEPPHYIVFFKGRDEAIIKHSLTEYARALTKQKTKPSIGKKLEDLGRSIQKQVHQKIRNKDRGIER